MKIATILDQIDLGSMALPEFQRGYVWNRDQVRMLMRSLYRKYPVGSLLVWATGSENAHTRGDGSPAPGVVKLLLDGQQRITSLYGIVRGQPPRFFDGNAQVFSGLFFHLEDEAFEFYAPAKMQGNPLWIEVTALMKAGAGSIIREVLSKAENQAAADRYISRVNAIDQIKQVDLHIEEVVGPDKTVDVVVDIFNRVNSGGTKLSKGDLALARICGTWPEARDNMRRRLRKWEQAGFRFKLEWLLRIVNAVHSGQSYFTGLDGISPEQFAAALKRAEDHVDRLINLIGGRLGLDHDRVLGSRYSFPALARYLDERGGQLIDARERDRLLYWYVHTFLWGRYSGSTETVLAQDLSLMTPPAEALDRLVEQLRRDRGDLRVQPNDLLGSTKGARFYPLLYMLTRVWRARDWGTGLDLSSHALGSFSRLEVHHIFPKAALERAGVPKAERNLIANFTFLTKETNGQVSDRLPEEYLEEAERRHPGSVASHWIPMDRQLWKQDRYRDFLAARRALLARAANEFLDGLLGGAIPDRPAATELLAERIEAGRPVSAEDESEAETLREVQAWVTDAGLASGEYDFEVSDPESGEVIALLDLAWPNGLQEGLTRPVALLLNEPEDVVEAASEAGFHCFTQPARFMKYVRRRVLTTDGE